MNVHVTLWFNYSGCFFTIFSVVTSSIYYSVEILLSHDTELDALEADMGFETESDGVPSYLQPDKDSDLDSELNLPSAPSGHAANPAGRVNMQVIHFF